jgi:hypothetical protein
MGDRAWLIERFEEHRSGLRAVAYRMLGSRSEADDAVQEAWLRLSRADTSSVENLTGWLTTVVARVCLNTLRTRESRREEPGADCRFGLRPCGAVRRVPTRSAVRQAATPWPAAASQGAREAVRRIRPATFAGCGTATLTRFMGDTPGARRAGPAPAADVGVTGAGRWLSCGPSAWRGTWPDPRRRSAGPRRCPVRRSGGRR